MLHTITVDNFHDWRDYARDCLQQKIIPTTIQWLDNTTTQADLFTNIDTAPQAVLTKFSCTVPKQFLALAKKVACHRNTQKWHLLYSALWRITQGEKHLLQLLSDPLIHQLMQMRKQVSRDAHKMTAFVRFKVLKQEQQDYYVAWYKPQHKILELIAPFFIERFRVMNWSIFTPDGFMAWNQQKLVIDKTIITIDGLEDDIESLWLTYYRSTFNPARIKIKAMLKEMPRCYWETMPETKLISELLVEAPQRVHKMLNNEFKKN